ncbi:hypothetical protein FDECE_4302 [Fusarium decemcellulare]|nr:hypothetical protein FDECE_4302 [Fusarium decemcellulare]
MTRITRVQRRPLAEHGLPPSSQVTSGMIPKHEKNERDGTGMLGAGRLPSFTASRLETPLPEGGLSNAFADLSLDDANTPTSTSDDLDDLNLKEMLSPQLLGIICLHTISHGARIEPKSYANKLRILGSEKFASQLLLSIEDLLGGRRNPDLALEERIQLIKKRCHLRECPRYERPNVNKSNLSLRDSLHVLQRYKSLQVDFSSWPPADFDGHALIFASQAFGCLHHTLPAKIDPDEVFDMLNVLISLCRDICTPNGAKHHSSLFNSSVSHNHSLAHACGLGYGLEWHPSRPLAADSDLELIQVQDFEADLPKTPPPSECGDEALERFDIGIPADEEEEEGGHTTDDMISCGRAHTRVMTCADLISLPLESSRAMLGAVGCNDHDLATLLSPTLLQACDLLFRAERRNGRQGDACIKCIWASVMEKCPQYRVEWAISSTESLLSLQPLPSFPISMRIQSCGRILNVTDSSSLPRPLPDGWFPSTSQAIGYLQSIPRFRLEEKDFLDVLSNPEKQGLYAAACLSELDRSTPENVLSRLLEIFSRIIHEVYRQSCHRSGKWQTLLPTDRLFLMLAVGREGLF